jgi:hypothetical protein
MAEPVWSNSIAEVKLNLINIYNGDIRTIEGLIMLSYASLREPNNALLYPLQQDGFPKHPSVM